MKALVLGGVAPHIELLLRLKELGYFTILVDYLNAPPAREYADRYYMVSTLDKEKVLDIARQEQINLIISICVDHANVTMCYVAEKLGLPLPYSYETAINATDKARMKQIMQQYGIPTSDYCTVDRFSSIPEALSYPVVVKPTDNNGSKGVKRVNTPEELPQRLDEALSLSRSGRAIIEGFNEGREIQVDCFANHDKAHVIMIREKLKIPNENGLAMQSYGSIIPAQLSDQLHTQIISISQKIADGFKLEHTPFFFQAIVNDDTIRVLELSPRIGGGLSYKMLKHKAGFDVIDAVIHSYFGNLQCVDLQEKGGFLVTNILYAVDGVFDRVTGIEEMLQDHVIDGFDLMAEPGKLLGNTMDSRNRIGAYFITASNMCELIEKVEKAHAAIDVLTPGGRSILRKDLYFSKS